MFFSIPIPQIGGSCNTNHSPPGDRGGRVGRGAMLCKRRAPRWPKAPVQHWGTP